jgi:hypothetical protein
MASALEERAGYPSEKLVQAIWNHQRLRRGQLRLTDGRPLRVLHPGFLNRGAGPDFRDAVLQAGNDAPRRGDVEIDLHSRNWRQHGHDRNPAFAGVILHAVWEACDRPEVATVVLRDFLEDSLPDAAAWLGTEEAANYPKDLLGRCASPLAAMPADTLDELLVQAARARFKRKAAMLRSRAGEAGWEQALWEGLARGLGYQANTWPMLRLGELRPWLASGPFLSPLQAQARLLGVADLLPSDHRRTGPRPAYLGQLWDLWWRERHEYSEVLLPASVWRLAGLRPANHPCRRLALLAEWWTRHDFVAQIESWLARPVPEAQLPSSLGEILQDGAESFWNWHWTFRSARLPRPQPLIGQGRVTDLAVNVLLPWSWAKTQSERGSGAADEAWRRYVLWPAALDNAVLRLARQRLLGGKSPAALRRASRQQGLLQIVADFCETSDALCSACGFPAHLRSLSSVEGEPGHQP